MQREQISLLYLCRYGEPFNDSDEARSHEGDILQNTALLRDNAVDLPS